VDEQKDRLTPSTPTHCWFLFDILILLIVVNNVYYIAVFPLVAITAIVNPQQIFNFISDKAV